MGIGKILTYTVGGVVVGVGAVAAAPCTGGGSILAAVTFASSLAGAGTMAAAAGAAAVMGGAGAYVAMKENEENEERDIKCAEQARRADKFQEDLSSIYKERQDSKEHYDLIVALTAVGIAMASMDGEIAPEEKEEIGEFIGGISSSEYPPYVKEAIETLYNNPPNLRTAIAYMEKIDPSDYGKVRSLILLIMDADSEVHPREEAFLQAFDDAFFNRQEKAYPDFIIVNSDASKYVESTPRSILKYVESTPCSILLAITNFVCDASKYVESTLESGGKKNG